MLLEAEEENDAKAAQRAGAEQAAELAEFDENFLQNQASEYEVWLTLYNYSTCGCDPDVSESIPHVSLTC